MSLGNACRSCLLFNTLPGGVRSMHHEYSELLEQAENLTLSVSGKAPITVVVTTTKWMNLTVIRLKNHVELISRCR